MAKNSLLKGMVKALQYLLVLAAVMFAVDWWRKPSEPETFVRQVLTLQDGRYIQPAQWSEARTGVVYFWATWCSICRYTSPDVMRLQQDGVPVIGVALQSGGDDEVAAYMRQHGLAFANINDGDGRLSRDWNVAVTPTIVLLKNGKMVHHTTGISSYWGLKLRLMLADWLA